MGGRGNMAWEKKTRLQLKKKEAIILAIWDFLHWHVGEITGQAIYNSRIRNSSSLKDFIHAQRS